jgi:hypothetical protein
MKLWGRLWRPRRPRTSAGRPPGTGRWRDRGDFERAVRAACEALAEKGRHPTQEAVCRVLFCDPRSLRRWLRQYGVSWTEIARRSLSKRP